jgi:hypothetical protein
VTKFSFRSKPPRFWVLRLIVVTISRWCGVRGPYFLACLRRKNIAFALAARLLQQCRAEMHYVVRQRAPQRHALGLGQPAHGERR